ncbi:MAG: GNAT family N-acetyltransferase [Verrucomicrobiaceae bacterium]|nr:GNAT family N-acetyltransferase [Verrucomicrobiaceae bacterium]
MAAAKATPGSPLAVHRVGREAWSLFRGHHYLSADIHRAARCYAAFWNDKPVAFVATLPSPGIKRAYREHRLVVLPDYQGVGIGNAMSEFIANIYVSQGLKYFSCTSHPGLIHHRAKSKLWFNQRLPKSRISGKNRNNADKFGGGTRCGSLTATFEFLGRRPE